MSVFRKQLLFFFFRYCHSYNGFREEKAVNRTIKKKKDSVIDAKQIERKHEVVHRGKLPNTWMLTSVRKHVTQLKERCARELFMCDAVQKKKK